MTVPVKIPIHYAYAKLNESNRGYPSYQQVPLESIENVSERGLIRLTHLRVWFRNNRAYQQFRRDICVPHEHWQAAMAEDPAIRAYVRRQMRMNPLPATSRSNSRNTSPTRYPRRKSQSPRSRSPSPRSCSPSPRSCSPSPRSRSPSPRNRSSSPRNRSSSPRNRSRSPTRNSLKGSSSPTRKSSHYRKGELAMTTKLGRLSRQDIQEAPASVMSIQPTGDECDQTDVNLPLPVCNAINKICRRYSPTRHYMPYRTDGSERKNYQIKTYYV